jgi:hypothetical protein
MHVKEGGAIHQSAAVLHCLHKCPRRDTCAAPSKIITYAVSA